MSKVEELSKKLCDWAKEQQPHEPEFLFVDCLIDLIQAVQDEERSKTCPVCTGLPPVGSISELIWKCDKCGSEILSIFYRDRQQQQTFEDREILGNRLVMARELLGRATMIRTGVTSQCIWKSVLWFAVRRPLD